MFKLGIKYRNSDEFRLVIPPRKIWGPNQVTFLQSIVLK